MVISIAFCDFALWDFDSENFGLVFFRFLMQNEAFSATEQNQTYNHSFLEDLVQISSISSVKAASASTAN